MRPATDEGAKIYTRANLLWHKREHELTDDVVSLLAPDLKGKGLTPDQVTLAHLVDPDLLGEYMDSRKRRDPRNVRLDEIDDAISYLHPKHGFLTLQVELVWHYEKLGIEPVDMAAPDAASRYAAAKEQWAAKAAEWRDDLEELSRRLQANRSSRTRDRLLPVLRHPEPLSVIEKIIAGHHAVMPPGVLIRGTQAAHRLAVWVRDQLLLRMLASNPLRNRNFREMRYVEGGKADGGGNLYRMPAGEWRIRFQPHEFKNEQGAARELYDVAVPPDLWSLVDLYVNEARPILLKERKSDLVFITRTGRKFTVSTLSMRVCFLTGSFMDEDLGMYGFATHAFRHIVATAWLRANPKDYITVAQILHDTIETVIKNYGHTTPDDGLKTYAGWLGTIVTPFKKAA